MSVGVHEVRVQRLVLEPAGLEPGVVPDKRLRHLRLRLLVLQHRRMRVRNPALDRLLWDQLLQHQPRRRLPLHPERQQARLLLPQDVRRGLWQLGFDHRLPLPPVRQLLRDHAVLLRVMAIVLAERDAEARAGQSRAVALVSTAVIDPFAISAVAVAAVAAAVLLAGASLSALTVAVALLAGWSSAWSP